MRNYMEEYQRWLDSPALSNAEWEELNAIRDDKKEIESRFFAPLEFGTAGLRGEMALGCRRMNIHVIRHATQAFAEVIKAEGAGACSRGIAICFDCRVNSERFAHEAASVMAANGIHVRIFDALRPTPELSFAVKHYGTTAGLNITASHNPKEYNGYKVYWSDGAQLPPHHADAIAKRLEEIDIFNDIQRMDFDDAVRQGLVEFMGAETDEAFLANVLRQPIDPDVVRRVADRLSPRASFESRTGWGRVAVDSLSNVVITSLPGDRGVMPDVRGMGLKDALFVLESRGLKVRFSGRGAVTQQSITAGARIAPGTAVVITLK